MTAIMLLFRFCFCHIVCENVLNALSGRNACKILFFLLTEMCCAPEPDEGEDLLGQIGGAIKISIFCFVMVNKKKKAALLGSTCAEICIASVVKWMSPRSLLFSRVE